MDEPPRVETVRELYPSALAEIFAVTSDYFMLTNVGVFRGSMLSSMSMNVVARRWGVACRATARCPGT